MSNNILEDAINEGFRRAGGGDKRLPDSYVQSIAFEVNSFLGRESNEGIRAARREAAIAAIVKEFGDECINDLPGEYMATLDAILKSCQGEP